MTDLPACKKSIALKLEIESLASQCVKCGLCLPHCPTYHLTQDENESPRGRIELLRALAQENLSYTPKLKSHLDHCLTCRACEHVCPANVEYGQLITQGRILIQTNAPKALRAPHKVSLLSLISHPKILRALHWLAWFAEITKIRTIARKTGITKWIKLNTFDNLLPTIKPPIKLKSFYPAMSKKVGSVGLFLGCIQKMTDTEIFQASIHVLTAFGYDVHIPPDQGCCGAMELHAGHLQSASSFAQSNLDAFSNSASQPMDHIVTLASGCGTTLSDYAKYFGSGTIEMKNKSAQKKSLESFASKIVDVSSLIQKTPWPKNLKLKKIPHRFAMHSPCTLKNVWSSENDVFEIIKRISTHDIYTIKNQYCCGAAGRYMFDFPEVSKKLVNKISRELAPLAIDILLTSNTGCALHFKQHFQQKKLNISVKHPIVVLSHSINF